MPQLLRGCEDSEKRHSRLAYTAKGNLLAKITAVDTQARTNRRYITTKEESFACSGWQRTGSRLTRGGARGHAVALWKAQTDSGASNSLGPSGRYGATAMRPLARNFLCSFALHSQKSSPSEPQATVATVSGEARALLCFRF